MCVCVCVCMCVRVQLCVMMKDLNKSLLLYIHVSNHEILLHLYWSIRIMVTSKHCILWFGVSNVLGCYG